MEESMKPVFEGGEPLPQRKRVDFGDAPISNARYNCEKCLLAEECKFSVNTLNCEIANKRLKRLLAEGEVKTNTSEELKSEEEKSVKEFFNSIQTESSSTPTAEDKDEEEDDD